jgi:hypothetical protein
MYVPWTIAQNPKEINTAGGYNAISIRRLIGYRENVGHVKLLLWTHATAPRVTQQVVVAPSQAARCHPEHIITTPGACRMSHAVSGPQTNQIDTEQRS